MDALIFLFHVAREDRIPDVIFRMNILRATWTDCLNMRILYCLSIGFVGGRGGPSIVTLIMLSHSPYPRLFIPSSFPSRLVKVKLIDYLFQ